MTAAVALAHLVSTLFMAGVIVFVQVVHYPLMARVGGTEFQAYQRGHTTRTAWVVGPAMVVELTCAVLLVFDDGGRGLADLAVLGLVLLAVVWISTVLLQAPAHGRLLRGFDAEVHRGLVRLNWIRTVAWLARIPVAVGLL